MRISITPISAVAFAIAPNFANAANIDTASRSVGYQVEPSVPEDSKASISDFPLSKRSNEENVKFVGDGLESLTFDMMSIIGPMGFMFNEFDENAVDYAMKLLDLKLAVKEISPPDASILKKLDYTNRVSREMTEAVLLEKIFKKAAVKEYDILRNIIQEDLNILRYFNSSGEPNVVDRVWHLSGGRVRGNNVEYAIWLGCSKGRLENLKSTFASIEAPPNVVRCFFEDRVQIISRKLQELCDFYRPQADHPELPE